MSVRYEIRDRVAVVTIDRPERRNAVDNATAESLLAAWRRFDSDDAADIGVLHGTGGVFSAGADLKAFDLVDRPEGYLGFTRMEVSKPTIAAIEGHCVAGGLEMALWCDLRVAGASAVLGCFERRFGVPLVDGGTQRLPRIVGRGIAMEMILTGRPVGAEEAFQIGLVNLVVEDGDALRAAVAAGRRIVESPQETLRADRRAVLEGADLPIEEGLQVERRYGRRVLHVARRGAAMFAQGAGRSGAAVPDPDHRRDTWTGIDVVPRVGTTLELDVDGERIPTHLVLPPDGAGPALLLLHDRWGLDSTVFAAAERLAEAGFVCAAVGLLTPGDPTGGEGLDDRVAGLAPNRVGRVLVAAVQALDALPVTSGRLGAVGFGMGGGLAMWLATSEAAVSACVAYAPTSPWSGLRPDFEQARAVFLGHFGELDEVASAHTASQLELRLRTMGVDATFETYRRAGPEFYRSRRPDGDDLEASDLAWARTVAFLHRVL